MTVYEYDQFMSKYNSERKYCPKCKGKDYCTTLVCYVLDMNRKEEYKDKNKCECSSCGDTHYFHDRVAK